MLQHVAALEAKWNEVNIFCMWKWEGFWKAGVILWFKCVPQSLCIESWVLSVAVLRGDNFKRWEGKEDFSLVDWCDRWVSGHIEKFSFGPLLLLLKFSFIICCLLSYYDTESWPSQVLSFIIWLSNNESMTLLFINYPVCGILLDSTNRL